MKRPVFSQLDRLADYELDDVAPGREWAPTKRRNPLLRRRELDELIRDDGRVVDRREDDDAE